MIDWNLAVFGVGCYIVSRIIGHFVITHLRNKLELKQRIITYFNEITHQVEIQKVDKVQYWYDKDTKQFIAQGHSREEIISVLKSNWHNHLFLITDTELLAGPDFNPVDPNIKESV